jgi:hypothetical protein
VSADGFVAGSTVFVEQCDGTSPTSVGWSPATNCDLGSSPASVSADATGLATFNAADASHAFKPFKGESPQSLFNCLATDDSQPSANGLPDFTNCQVRISTSNLGVTGDQQFFTITLPTKPTVPSKDPLGSIRCSAAVQETIKPAISTTRSIKAASIKTVKTAPTKVPPILGSVAGTRVPGGSCDNSHVSGGKLDRFKQPIPIVAGQIQLKAKGDIGWSCSNLLNPPLVKPQVQVKWEGFVDGKFKSISTTKAGVQSVTVVSAPNLALDIVSTPVLKGGFTGDRLLLHLVSDLTNSDLQTECASPTGVVALNFTGVIGPSTIAAQP